MATAALQFKIMPENIDTNLEKLKQKIKQKIESFPTAIFTKAKEEPIAFGLKALIITLALSENEESDKLENAIREIKGVSSVELIDYRRALG